MNEDERRLARSGWTWGCRPPDRTRRLPKLRTEICKHGLLTEPSPPRLRTKICRRGPRWADQPPKIWLRPTSEIAATIPEQGIVNTQAIKMLVATPQRTAETRLLAPTPMMQALMQ